MDVTGRAAERRFVLGRQRFERISAIEGIALSDDAREHFARLDRSRRSAEERREAIIAKHRLASA